MMEDAISTSFSSRTSSPSTAVADANTVTRPIGFFPLYVPDSFSEANTSFDDIDPPPYPTDSLLHGQDPPPYPIDELPYSKNLPPYPLCSIGPDADLPIPIKIDSSYPPQGCAGPSAPMITEQEHKIGLTPSEREELFDALTQMKHAIEEKTEINKKGYANAQRKLKELLLVTRSRLTETDKEEFINEVKRIDRIRKQKESSRNVAEKKERIRKETERRRSSQSKEECHCDIWSIVFKIFQLGMVILAYAENKQWKTTQLFIFLCFFTTVSTICLLIFYSFGRRPPLIVLKTECIYCISCILGFYTATFTQTWRSFKMPLFGIGAMAGYALDIIRIFCLFKKRISSSRNNHTTVPELRKSDNEYLRRRGGSRDSNHHHIVNTTYNYTNYPRNNILDDTFLDLDFLNDDCSEKNVDIHNDCHHNSSLLPTSSDHHRSNRYYSSKKFTNSDNETTKNKMRLLLNPITV